MVFAIVRANSCTYIITWNEQVTSVVFADVRMAILIMQHNLDQDQILPSRKNKSAWWKIELH